MWRLVALGFLAVLAIAGLGREIAATASDVKTLSIVPLDTASAPVAYTLPAIPAFQQGVVVKDGTGHAATNNITISPATGTIDGASSVAIRQDYGAIIFIYTSQGWGAYAATGAAGSSPGGANTSVQFNQSGAFGGDAAYFSWDDVTHRLTVIGDIQLAANSALATTATGGFPYIPTMAGVPTGIPALASAGRSAVVIDSTNHHLCWYEQAGGGWQCDPPPGGPDKSIQYKVDANTFGGIPMTSGQVIIGSTGAVPVATSLTAGSGIAITPGPGSISIAATSSGGISQLTGDVAAGPGSGSQPATIQPAVVSYAKIQNVGGSRLLGNPTGSAATASEIALGTGLGFSGGALVATGSLPSIADGLLLSNLSGGTAQPSGHTLTATLDYVLGTTGGSIPLRSTDSAAWLARQINSSGAWASRVAYNALSVVTYGGQYFIAADDIAEPLVVAGTASATWGRTSPNTITLTNTATGITYVVVAMNIFEGNGTQITSVTSPHLTFTLRDAHTYGSTLKTRLEVWAAPTASALSGEVITITQDAGTESAALAFTIAGATGFDTNVSLPISNGGNNTIPSISGLSTTNAQDTLLFCAGASVANDHDFTPPTGFTALITAVGPDLTPAACYYKSVSATQSSASIALQDTWTTEWAAFTDADVIDPLGPSNPIPPNDFRWVQISPASGLGTVTSVGLSVPSSSLFSVTGSPVTSSGTLALATAGTSGGVPYFSSSSQLNTSAALAVNQITLGGGAGTAPATLGSLGTATTVLHGNASGAPTFGAVSLSADVTGNLPVSNLNSGTSASNTTYWRGDGTWGTPSGSGTTFTGLFSIPATIGAAPTASGTGFSTWLNQGGASVADFDDGIRITVPGGSGDNLRCRTQAAPSTPYTKKAVIALEASLQNYQSSMLGWYDGSNKLQVFQVGVADDSGGVIDWGVSNWTNNTTFSSNIVAGQHTNDGKAYVEISDDGTSIAIKVARFGSPNLTTIYTVAKASGFLGSGGYTNLVFCGNRNNTHGTTTSFANLLYWN